MTTWQTQITVGVPHPPTPRIFFWIRTCINYVYNVRVTILFMCRRKKPNKLYYKKVTFKIVVCIIVNIQCTSLGQTKNNFKVLEILAISRAQIYKSNNML